MTKLVKAYWAKSLAKMKHTLSLNHSNYEAKPILVPLGKDMFVCLFLLLFIYAYYICYLVAFKINDCSVLPFLDETERSFSSIPRCGQKYTILYSLSCCF